MNSKSKKYFISLIALVLLMTIVTGCQSAKPVFDPNAGYYNYEFPENQKSEELKRISDRNDPEEVVQFARSVSAEGRYKEAAEIYLDAADNFKSKSGNFEIDCKMAAVKEYWLAGELKMANEQLTQIESMQDIYLQASENEQIKKLRTLLKEGDKLQSETNKKSI